MEAFGRIAVLENEVEAGLVDSILTEREIREILRHGSKSDAWRAAHYVRRRSDIPGLDRGRSHAFRLTNVVVVVVNGRVVTVYRNDKPFRQSGKKTDSWFRPDSAFAA